MNFCHLFEDKETHNAHLCHKIPGVPVVGPTGIRPRRPSVRLRNAGRRRCGSPWPPQRWRRGAGDGVALLSILGHMLGERVGDVRKREESGREVIRSGPVV